MTGSKQEHSRKSTDGRKPEHGIPFKTTPEPNSIKKVAIPRTPGATVWASFWNFGGAFKPNPSTGWSHCLSGLHNLDELVAFLEKSQLRNRVARLAMVAHNDEGKAGIVTFDPPLPGAKPVAGENGRLPAAPTSVESFQRIESFLLPDAMVEFHVCRSGAGSQGDQFLKSISNVLPGRTIVAFCVYVVVAKGGGTDPGNSCGTDEQGGICSPAMRPLTPWGIAAKRALNGDIVHTPYLEKKGTKRVTEKTKFEGGFDKTVEEAPYYCAKKGCPGHNLKGDDCDGY